MKPELEIPYLDSPDNAQAVSTALDEQPQQALNNAPWAAAYPYKPEVFFAIAHGDSAVYLKFYVSENATQALHTRINEPVYKDSCVEFFVAFDNEDNYYNFEFNCAGNCLVGFGAGRDNRTLLPVNIIKQIKTETSMVTQDTDAPITWQLTVVIPFEAFHYHHIISLENQTCRANFYKCGDDLPQPHFLSWNNIETTQPDFHRPEFFGKVVFKQNQYHLN